MSIAQYLIILASLLFTQSALAHKLNLFTYVENGQVHIEGYFADGKRVQNSKVSVFNDQRELINEGSTNDKGEYNFTPTKLTDMRIIVDAGMGHVAEYNLSTKDIDTTKPTESTASAAQATSSASAISQQEIKSIIDHSVNEAVKPLVREISELKSKTSFSDIIGGFGFIIGALGAFAYAKARKG